MMTNTERIEALEARVHQLERNASSDLETRVAHLEADRLQERLVYIEQQLERIDRETPRPR